MPRHFQRLADVDNETILRGTAMRMQPLAAGGVMVTCATEAGELLGTIGPYASHDAAYAALGCYVWRLRNLDGFPHWPPVAQ